MAAFARSCPGPFRPPNQSAARPTKWQPGGPESCWRFAVSDACSPACQSIKAFCRTHAPLLLGGFEGAKLQRLCRPSGYRATLNLAGVSLFRMRAHRPAKAFCPTHPSLLLTRSKVPNCSGSADQVATPWA